jgi:hypothetical protein
MSTAQVWRDGPWSRAEIVIRLPRSFTGPKSPQNLPESLRSPRFTLLLHTSPFTPFSLSHIVSPAPAPFCNKPPSCLRLWHSSLESTLCCSSELSIAPHSSLPSAEKSSACTLRFMSFRAVVLFSEALLSSLFRSLRIQTCFSALDIGPVNVSRECYFGGHRVPGMP